MGPPSPAAPDGCDKPGLLPQGPLSCRTWRRGTVPSALPRVATPWLGVTGSQPPQAWGLLVRVVLLTGPVSWRSWKRGPCSPLWEPGGLRLSQDPSQHTGWHSPGHLSAQHSSFLPWPPGPRPPRGRQLALDKERPGPAVHPEPLCCGSCATATATASQWGGTTLGFLSH